MTREQLSQTHYSIQQLMDKMNTVMSELHLDDVPDTTVQPIEHGGAQFWDRDAVDRWFAELRRQRESRVSLEASFG